jgi:RNA polymerase sigma-70 factor (ECF subfamily)
MLNFSTTTTGWLGHFPTKILASDRPKTVERPVKDVGRLGALTGGPIPPKPAQEVVQTTVVEPSPFTGPTIAALERESFENTGQSNEPSGEAWLIAQAQTGNQAAFAELVEMHQDFVFNLAFRILQNYEEADDASQEAFVKIWQALPNFRGDAKFTTWAYRIVRNGCLNRLRSLKSNPRLVSVETSFEEGDEGETDILANLPGDQSEEPAWRFDTSERRQLIWDQVDGLPVKYREIIALYYGQEMSYEEIAAALEVPVGTVKTHLYRAKAQLKNRLVELEEKGALDFGN